jgi:hypothetical protein
MLDDEDDELGDLAGDGVDDDDMDAVAETSPPAPPPVRQVAAPQEPRRGRPPAKRGPSPWEGKSRDGFTASMGARVDEMRRSPQASFVKGVTRD